MFCTTTTGGLEPCSPSWSNSVANPLAAQGVFVCRISPMVSARRSPATSPPSRVYRPSSSADPPRQPGALGSDAAGSASAHHAKMIDVHPKLVVGVPFASRLDATWVLHPSGARPKQIM